MKVKFFAPSHGLRLLEAMSTGQVPKLDATVQVIAKAGVPIWFDFFNEQIRDSKSTIYFLMIGDFRFGNRICEGMTDKDGIDKNLITPINDQFLYDKTIIYLEKIYKNNICILFWDLACSENENIKSRKYYFGSKYKHPTWNLEACENNFFHKTIKLSPLLKDGLLDALYIDKSKHPSLLGYIFLQELILKIHNMTRPTDIDIFDTYYSAKDKITKFFNELPKSKNTVIGDSTFINHTYYFRNRGIIDKSFTSNKVTLSDISEFVNSVSSDTPIVYVTDIIFDGDINGYDNRIMRLEKQLKNKNVKLIFWKAWSNEVNKSRNIGKQTDKRFLFSYYALEKLFTQVLVEMPPSDSVEAQSLVEISQDCQPTLKGMLWVYMSNCMSYNDFLLVYNKMIRNNK